MWDLQWSRIDNKINGLVEAAHLVFQVQPKGLNVQSFDWPLTVASIRDTLVPLCMEVRTDAQSLHDLWHKNLPQEVLVVLSSFLSGIPLNLELKEDHVTRTFLDLLTRIAAFRTKINFLLATPERQAVRRIRRAFRHLQWSIATSERTREDWQEAFEQGEEACERMGATHLLSQGIWAFKVSTPEARTDLILRGLSGTEPSPEREADFMLLTEWKLTKKNTDHEPLIRAGIAQAALYGGGVFHGIEVLSHRFVIIVSRETYGEPEMRMEAGTAYHVISLAVSPLTPSVTARKSTRRRKEPT